MDRVPNVWIRELCGVTKEEDERIDKGVLLWFDHVEKDRIAKRVYVGQTRWIDTVKDCLRKEVWMSVKQGEWCRIGVNGGGL